MGFAQEMNSRDESCTTPGFQPTFSGSSNVDSKYQRNRSNPNAWAKNLGLRSYRPQGSFIARNPRASYARFDSKSSGRRKTEVKQGNGHHARVVCGVYDKKTCCEGLSTAKLSGNSCETQTCKQGEHINPLENRLISLQPLTVYLDRGKIRTVLVFCLTASP